MGRLATITLREHVDDDMLLQIARSMGLYRPPCFLDGPPEEDEEQALFGDHDVRATDRGYYRYPEEECRSRRVDLRGPTDLDPGPLEMQEPEPPRTDEAVVLGFRDDRR